MLRGEPGIFGAAPDQPGLTGQRKGRRIAEMIRIGAEKAERVSEWLAANAPDGTAHIRAYSDHLSDAPTFALAGEAWLIGRGDKYVRLAAKHGWRAADFEDAAVAEHR